MAGKNHQAASSHEADDEHGQAALNSSIGTTCSSTSSCACCCSSSACLSGRRFAARACCRRRSWATRSPAASRSFGRPSLSPLVIADSICERILVLAGAVDFELVLGRGEHLLGGFDRAGLRRELFDDVARDSRRHLAGAGPLMG